MQRNVRVIPATVNAATLKPINTLRKRRVAAYARVSTDKDEQFTSYEAQIDYYEKMIFRNPDWEYAGTYADEGITGTNTHFRNGFNEMIRDALDGKIDLIVTKSVSRFARNTVDSLVTVRKLKDKGVEVYFEKENIYTLDSKGELLITIMSSLAQEESRSISENVTWGHRKRFSDGKFSLGYSHFLGYDKGSGTDEPLKINEEEAELVRRIYREYLQGKSAYRIATDLTREEIPTPSGKSKWWDSTIKNILENEKYMGAARLQKSFTPDFLNKKHKKNEGEVPQYWIENSHEAIIPPEQWHAVQNELRRRQKYGHHYSSKYLLSSRLRCGDCGAVYGPKVWDSTDPRYRHTVWQCNDKFKGKKCTTPHVTEEAVKIGFMKAIGKLISIKVDVLDRLVATRAALTHDNSEELASLRAEAEMISAKSRKLIEENASPSGRQTDFEARFSEYSERHQAIITKIENLELENAEHSHQLDVLDSFEKTLAGLDAVPENFDAQVWQTTIDKVIINTDGTMVYRFVDGTEITV